MSFTVWAITLLGLLIVLGFDFAMAWRNRNSQTTMAAATAWTLFYVSLAVIFGLTLVLWRDEETQRAFFAGWITEYSLSFDNLFVFILIIAKLRINKEKEELVLLIGIVSSLILRGIFIALGSAIVNRWSWIFFIFGGFLIYTAISLIRETEEEEWEEGKVLKWLEKKGASRIFIACAALALTDILFALDSIPAIFGLTKNAYVVTTANIFALMGLRQLYFLLEELLERLIYLSKGLSVILGFIGIKMIFEAFHEIGTDKIAGIHVPVVSIEASLMTIIGILIVTAVTSLAATRSKKAS